MVENGEELKELIKELKELRKRLDEIERRVNQLAEKLTERPKEEAILPPEEKIIPEEKGEIIETPQYEEVAIEIPEEKREPIEDKASAVQPIPKEEIIPGEPSFPEKPPKEIEFTLGSSVFQRIGLLFILIAFISAGYWIYSEITYGTSQYKIILIYIFVLMVYSGGFSLIFAGTRIHRSPSLPTWYGESMLATGVAILMAGALISRYWFFVINDMALAGIMTGIIGFNFILAKTLESKGLLLEGILNVIIVGFIIAWFLPYYPVAQIYMMTLFILLFVRLPENIRENSKIMAGFYSKFIILAAIQRYAVVVRGVEPNWLIQLVSVLSISLLYGSFELQRINYSWNSFLSAFSIVLISFILSCALEPVLVAIASILIIGMIIHWLKKPEIDLKFILIDEGIGLFYSIYLTIYGLFNYVMFAPPMWRVSLWLLTYPGLLILILTNLKIGLCLKSLSPEKIAEISNIHEVSIAIPVLNYFFFAVLALLTQDPWTAIVLPFIPISLTLINELTGMRGSYNYLLASISASAIFFFKNIDYLVVLISSVSYLLLIPMMRKLERGINEPLNMLFINTISLTAILRIMMINSSLSSYCYIILYSYLVGNALLLYSSKSTVSELSGRFDKAISLLYLDQIVISVSPIILVPPHLISIILIYSTINLVGYKSRYNHNLSLIILVIIPYIWSIINNVSISNLDIIALVSCYVFLLFMRGILVYFDHEAFGDLDFYLTIVSGSIALVSVTYDLIPLSIIILLSFLVANLLIGEKLDSMFHQAMSTYAFIGVVSTFYFGYLTLFNQIDITSLLYLMAFSIYNLITLQRKDFDLAKANLLAYPLLIYLFFIGHVINWSYVYLFALGIMSLSIYGLRDKLILEKPLYWMFYNSIFWLTNFIGAITTIKINELAIFAIYVADYYLLSRNKLIESDISFILNVGNNAVLLMLCFPQFTLSVPELQLLLAIYAYAGFNYLADWIPHSKDLTNLFFPIQLAFGYYFIFNEIQFMVYLAYATIAFISLSIALWRTSLMTAISVSAALVIMSFIEADSYLVLITLIILIASFTYFGMNTEPVAVLLALPPIISFTYNQNINPLISASIGVIFLVITEIRRSIKTEAKAYFLLHPIITYLISLGIIIASFYVSQIDLFITILTFGLGTMIISWLIDFLRDIRELSYYTLLGSITSSLVIAWRYLLSVETTIFVAVIGIFTLVAGMLTDRPPVRIIGLTTMLAIAFKGVMDIVWLIERTIISQFLRIALISLFLGGVFLSISYIYIKLYKFREQLKTRILGTKRD